MKYQPTIPESEAAYMRRAIELAQRGGGYTNPNPKVGAVIVKNGSIIGEGWHQRCGELHAERNALKNCEADPAGATIYVTLEPCCHHGKQPPCTEALLEAGITRVVIGSRDPNPKVHGKGSSFLREHGIEVQEDFLREECDQLNPSFFHYISTNRPFVSLKYAMTLDGKIATRTGESQWITGAPARQKVHELRGLHTAILVGSGTVLADNPTLTCRDADGLDPIRIVCDSRLRTPLDANLLTDIRDADAAVSRMPRTILATCETDEERLKPYRETGAEILILPQTANGSLDLQNLLDALGEQQIDSILVEGGGTMAWGFVEANLVHRVYAFVAPKIFGGKDAKSPIEGEGIGPIGEALELENPTVSILGEDLMVEGLVKTCLPE